MRDVFISYARGDKSKAELIAQALGREGFSVWWDRKIPPGKSYGQVIEKALNSAKCIIVLWSKQSILSDWVKDEAAEGVSREILIPAMIEDVTAPLGFRQFQTANLTDWKGDSAHPELQDLLDAVRAQLGLNRKETEPVASAAHEEAQRPVPKASKYAPVAFLCYDNRDKPFAEFLGSELQAHGVNVWLDKQSLREGDRWPELIPTVLEKQCDYVVVLQSPRMLDKLESYFFLEIHLAAKRQLNFKPGLSYLIPTILEADPRLPLEALRPFQCIDLNAPVGIDTLVRTILKDWQRRGRRTTLE